MAEWARLVSTTINDYSKGVEDKLLAKRVLLAMLKKTGNIEYNKGGLAFQWQTAYRQAPITINNGEQTVSPARQDRFKQPSLDYVGFTLADAMTKREKLKNRGAQALVEYFENMAKYLLDDASQRLSEELYVDSTASGNSGRLSGVETMMGATQTVSVASNSVTARSANAADVVAYPSNTYAGLSCSPGGIAGTWGTGTGVGSVWPAGKGDLSFDFWSPIIVNYTSTGFGGSSATWADQCVLATRYLVIHMSRYESSRGNMKTILMDRDLYRLYANKLDSKERINVSSQTGLRAMGFEDSLQQDGCDITYEYGMPAAVGYGFNADQMTLRSMQDRIFNTDGPTWHDLNRYYYVIVDFLGQLKFQTPRFFGKLVTLA